MGKTSTAYLMLLIEKPFINRKWLWKWRGKRRWFRFRIRNQHGKILSVEERWWWLSHQVIGRGWWQWNLVLWQSIVETLKGHTHYKRTQLKEICRITDSLTMEETLIHLDFDKSYKSKHQNEFQCTYFSTHVRIIKMVNSQSQLPPTRVISWELYIYRVPIKSSPIH